MNFYIDYSFDFLNDSKTDCFTIRCEPCNKNLVGCENCQYFKMKDIYNKNEHPCIYSDKLGECNNLGVRKNKLKTAKQIIDNQLASVSLKCCLNNIN